MDLDFSWREIGHLRAVAGLHPGLAVRVRDERDGTRLEAALPEGLAGYLAERQHHRWDVDGSPIVIEGERNGVRVVDIHLTKRTTRREPYTLVQLGPISDWRIDAQHPVLEPSAPDAPTAHNDAATAERSTAKRTEGVPQWRVSCLPQSMSFCQRRSNFRPELRFSKKP